MTEKYKTELKRLTDFVKSYLVLLDDTMQQPEGVERGRRIAVFDAWRAHVLMERGVDRRRIADSFDALDESERRFALSNARAALVAAEKVRAEQSQPTSAIR